MENEPKIKSEQEISEFKKKFDSRAEELGWKFTSLTGYDQEARHDHNPDGSPIYFGQAVYQDKDGRYADVFYVAEQLQTNKNK